MDKQTMFLPVFISLAVIFLTIFIHGFGSIWGVKLLLRKVGNANQKLNLNSALYLLSITAVYLMILHFIEIAVWALVFLLIPGIQELTSFEDAVYFSLITYTTVGYGDITLGPHWRIMSGFAAMDGIMLFGWSSALLFAVVQKILLRINPNS